MPDVRDWMKIKGAIFFRLLFDFDEVRSTLTSTYMEDAKKTRTKRRFRTTTDHLFISEISR
jgi:hypothetical protein